MSPIRVIGGQARGQKLRSVPGDRTRPITDRVKEALFNIIQQDISASSFLDLFAGTGSVGIEALSRGAVVVAFVDNQRSAIQTIKANLASTRLEENAQVHLADSFAYISRPENRQFDYVFIAPPQFKKLWSKALSILDDNDNWLGDDAWIIVQIHRSEFEELELQNLEKFDQRKYGNTLLLFYEHIEKAADPAG